MDATPFGRILEEVIGTLPGASGAIFVDCEGEAVDQSSRMESGEIQLMGAHWSIIYCQARRMFAKLELGAPAELIMKFDSQQVIIRRVAEGYLVVVTLAEGANLGRALGVIDAAETKLQAEM